MHSSTIFLLATTALTTAAAPFNASEGISIEANVNQAVKRGNRAAVEDRLPNISHHNMTGGNTATARFQHRYIRFTCEVEIGTRPKVFNLDIDTASSTSWLYGMDPKMGKYGYQRNVRNKSTYNGKKSKTSKRLKDASFREVYMDGSGALGSVYSDVMRIAGIESKKQAFGAAKIINPRIVSDVGFNGVLGLGKQVSNDEKGWGGNNKSFFANVGEQLAKNVFTLQMKVDGGRIEFGHINTALYTGDLFWMDEVPLNTPYHVFETSGYAIGNGTMQPMKMYAAPDTMASIILAPDAIADEYYDTFPLGVEKVILPGHHTGYTFPCHATFIPPDFTLQLRGNNNLTRSFVIPGKDIEFQVIRPGVCLGAIQAQTPREPSENAVTVLGWPFLQNKFIVFDGSNKIAFADAS